jgi:hypothetical protein
VIFHVRPEDRQPEVHNEIPGRLKVCSKSVVFVPSSHLLPMLKFPLVDCQAALWNRNRNRNSLKSGNRN